MSEKAIRPKPQQIRDRIVELRRVSGRELKANARNWRTHSDSQRAALEAVMQQVGFAGAILAFEEEGQLIIIDGHLRSEIADEETVPVLVTNLNREEANLVLATFDPIGAMADTNEEALKSLLDELDLEESGLDAIFEGMVDDDEEEEDGGLQERKIRPMPGMTWVLIGMPTVRFGEIAERIEELENVEGIVLHLTAND